MNILLLDAKEFSKVKGKVFYYTNYHSFNMNSRVAHIWSNGWCPVSQFKVDIGGNIYGRIVNELIPTGIYNNIIVTTNESTLKYKYQKAIAQ